MGQDHLAKTVTPGNASVGTTSTEVLSANSNRAWARVTNDSDTDIYLAYGVDAEANKGDLIVANGRVLTIDGKEPWKGGIDCIIVIEMVVCLIQERMYLCPRKK